MSVLAFRGTQEARKHYELTHGEIKGRVRGFSTEYKVVPLSPFEELSHIHSFLSDFQREDKWYIVVGGLSPESAKQVKAGKRIARNKGNITDEPSPLIVLDIDTHLVAEGEDYFSATDNTAPSVCFPDALKEVSFVRQLSGSAGLGSKGRSCVKAHYFLLASRPVSRAWLAAYFAKYGPKSAEGVLRVDPAMFEQSRAIFTSLPSLGDNVESAFTESERVKVVERTHDRWEISDELFEEVTALISTTSQESTSKGGGKRPSPPLNKEIEILEKKLAVRFPDVVPLSPDVEQTLAEQAQYASLYRDRVGHGGLWKDADICAKRNAYLVLNGLCGALQLVDTFTDAIVKVRGEHERRHSRSVVAKGLREGVEDRDNARSVVESAQQALAPIQSREGASSAEEINSESMSVIKRALAVSSESMSVAHLPTGAGKTSAVLREALLYASTRPVVIAFPTRDTRDEAAQKLLKIAPSWDYEQGVELLRASEERCTLREGGRRTTRNALLDQGFSLHQGDKKSACREVRCPVFVDHLENGGPACPAWGKPAKEPLSNGLYLCTHAKLNTLDVERLTPNALCVFDESPTAVFTRAFNVVDFAPLFASLPPKTKLARTMSGPNFHEGAPALALFTEELMTRLDALEPSQNEHEYALPLSDLLERWKETTLPLLARAALEEGEPSSCATTSALTSDLTRSQAEIARPTHITAAWKLAQCVAGELDAALWNVCVPPEGEDVWLEERALWKPPTTACVVLDATPNIARLEAVAQRGARSLEVFKGDPDKLNAHRTQGYFLKGGSFRTTALFRGRRKVIHKKTHSPLKTLARFIESSLCDLPSGERVGVLTHKPLRAILEAGRDKDEEGALLLSDVLKRYHVEWGHYGADSRGTNRFEDCAALVVVGTPNPHYGKTARDLAVIAPQASDEVTQADYATETTAELFQAFGRLRSLRRGGCKVVYAGDLSPLEGALNITWKREELVRGVRTNEDTLEALEHAHVWLREGEQVTIARLREELGLTIRKAKHVLERLAKHEGVTLTEGRRGAHILSYEGVEESDNAKAEGVEESDNVRRERVEESDNVRCEGVEESDNAKAEGVELRVSVELSEQAYNELCFTDNEESALFVSTPNEREQRGPVQRSPHLDTEEEAYA